jgi:uncharacterized membrane protein
MSEESAKASVHQTEMILGTLLRAGVVLSLAIVILGTVISFSHHPDYASSPSELGRLTQPGAAFPRNLHQVVAGVKRLEGRSVVVVGLMLLIATPVMRVAVSILIFVHQRDWIFTAITSVVLMLLLLSFVLGRVEG